MAAMIPAFAENPMNFLTNTDEDFFTFLQDQPTGGTLFLTFIHPEENQTVCGIIPNPLEASLLLVARATVPARGTRSQGRLRYEQYATGFGIRSAEPVEG